MALRCGSPLDALSLLLPAAPAFSRSPSFQNPLLARAILNAARSRPIQTRDLPSTLSPPHLDPFPQAHFYRPRSTRRKETMHSLSFCWV